MIITITCNPAIDKTVYENKTVFDIGGKGINVSKVLNNLNTKSIVTGFIGNENKDLVVNDLNSLEIENHFIEVKGKVRTNTKYIRDNNLIENNEDGPNITSKDIENLFNYLSNFRNEVIVISGSAPKSTDKNIYRDMVSLLKKNNNYVILDCANDLFKNAIEAKPNVIKPNKEEICKYFNVEYDKELIINKCKELDIDLICLSLGEDGAIFIGNEVIECKPLKIKYSSAVGAGDAMVASIAYGKVNNYDLVETIKLAMACASAACETEGTKPPEYDSIMMKINEVKL